MRSEEAFLFRFAVLFAAVVLMAAQALGEVSLKKLHALNAYEGIDLNGKYVNGWFLQEANHYRANLTEVTCLQSAYQFLC